MSDSTTPKSQDSEVLDLGSIRNFHPLLGDPRYNKEPYPGWELAKEVLKVEEVLPIINAYFARSRDPGVSSLSGKTWEEVEAEVKTFDAIRTFFPLAIPILPDFFLLLAKATGKAIRIRNHSYSGGEFSDYGGREFHPDGTTKPLPSRTDE